jgi:ABC-type Mn2+/Zn2+ transport system permease subunit
MFRAFVFGVVVAIVIALVGGYFVLRNGIIPANADGTPSAEFTGAASSLIVAIGGYHHESAGP